MTRKPALYFILLCSIYTSLGVEKLPSNDALLIVTVQIRASYYRQLLLFPPYKQSELLVFQLISRIFCLQNCDIWKNITRALKGMIVLSLLYNYCPPWSLPVSRLKNKIKKKQCNWFGAYYFLGGEGGQVRSLLHHLKVR